MPHATTRPYATTRVLLTAVALFAILAATGCATVEPWQRGTLADPAMIFDANGDMAAYTAHWQESREGAMGGFGVQAGGCGCK